VDKVTGDTPPENVWAPHFSTLKALHVEVCDPFRIELVLFVFTGAALRSPPATIVGAFGHTTRLQSQ
jgi:hypothetical protein